MNRGVCGVYSFVALLLTACGLTAQPIRREFISVCGARLELGMSQSTVLPELSRSCQPHAVEDDGTTWLLKSSQKAGLYFGMVQFRSGRLFNIVKWWYSSYEGGEPYDVAAAVCSVFEHFQEEGQKSCSFETHRKDTRGVVLRDVALTCGKKIISVTAHSIPNAAPTLFVTEELAEGKPLM